MRGQLKDIKSFKLSGNVYLLHYHDKELENPEIGDIYLYLNNEDEMHFIIMSGYQQKGLKGYFKAKIHDGRDWCLLNSLDFFEDRLNQFSKSDICIYTFNLCQERLVESANSIVYRTYRDHYSTQAPIVGEYKGKKTKKKK